MKRLLVVTADYYPYPSSNTNCYNPLLYILESEGWHIDIITRRHRKDIPYFEKESDTREVWRIDDRRTINTIRVNSLPQRNSNLFLKKIYCIYGYVSKAIYYLLFCFKHKEPRFSGWEKKKAEKKCMQLFELNQYEIILSISHPVITHEIIYKIIEKLKKSSVKCKWLIYEFDPFCYNEYLYGHNCYKKYFKKQVEFFEKCDGIILIPELYDFYQNTSFSVYKSKMYSIGFPNMKSVEIEKSNIKKFNLSNNVINCIYAGALTENLRDPQYAFKVFKECSENLLHWTIFSGSRLNFIKNDINQLDHIITVCPPVNQDTIFYFMKNSDILVNIGNSVAFQTPGKIFEYMALGKPIIHFSKIDNDPCLKYFKNYPMLLIINEKEAEPKQHAKKIEEFCIKYKGKQLSFEEVSNYIPELVSENITKQFTDLINNLASK